MWSGTLALGAAPAPAADTPPPSLSAGARAWLQGASANHFNELGGADAPDLAPHWAQFFQQLEADGPAGLDRRQRAMARQLRDNGVTYNVYADDGLQRPWSLDLLPLIIPPQDWAAIETGVLQRTRLANRLLADVYGPQRLLHEGLLPPALVQGHPGYLRAMRGVTPPGGTWLHIAAFDLAHGPDGRWWVVSNRTQAPSGLGYLLENRIAISRQFPAAFSALKVQRVAGSYKALVQGLQALSPQGADARIALLTPGPYNETYFEHAYLARYLGLTLVEGSDLTVRDQRVYLKTLHGLEPVDVLIKRLDDEWLDPLELRADSALGVPGLMQAVRAGHVLLANAPGSAPLESSAMQGFLPAICERLLGEPLQLPSLDTWWCGEAASLGSALSRLPHSVVKPTYPGTNAQTVMGPSLSTAELRQLTERLLQRPDAHTLQTYLPLSHQPTWHQGALVPRAAMLRVFALADGPDSWRVLPGGMVRLAPEGRLIASMQRGGSSADCWVLTDGEPDPTSLLRPDQTPGGPPPHKRIVTSRSAENLFWLGRYTERADNSVRQARLTLRLLQGEAQDDAPLRQWLGALARQQGLVLFDTPLPTHDRGLFERGLTQLLGADSGACSVGYNLRALRQSAAQVRERLSQEQRALIERVDDTFQARFAQFGRGAGHDPQAAQEALDEASALLAAITGAQTDRMVRDDGWRLLSIGRHIERLQTLASALLLALQTESLRDDNGYEALLSLFDSTITFHAQYQQRRDLVALVDMLVVHPDNPRSLGWVLSTLRSRLAKLPQGGDAAEGLLVNLPNPADWDWGHLAQAQPPCEASAGAPSPLVALLQTLEAATHQLSNRLTERCFSHADRVNQSLVT